MNSLVSQLLAVWAHHITIQWSIDGDEQICIEECRFE
jgi:predicted nucleic acid-binding Zn ribbon protein